MKKNIFALSVASLIMVNSAFAVEDKVYAVVNGDTITSQSIAIALKDPRVNFETLPKETQKTLLDKMIEQKLLSQNAMKTDVVNNPVYKKTLKSLKQDLALQVWLQEESKKIKISNDILKKYYNENKKLFNIPVQYHARHILLKTKKDANDIIDKLNKSKNIKTTFINLAKTKSTGPSGKNGGDLGFFKPEQMVPSFSSATAKLEKGQYTKSPVKTQFGYHVIYLEDKNSAKTVDFNQAKVQIQQKLAQGKLFENIQNLANKLKKQAKIEYK